MTDAKNEREDKIENPYKVGRSVIPSYDALPLGMKTPQETWNYKYFMKPCKKIVQPLGESVCARFMIDVCGRKRKGHLALILYCCDIPEGKETSNVKHVLKVYTCEWCLASKYGIRELKARPTRIAHEMG